jgi:hypothetical protein
MATKDQALEQATETVTQKVTVRRIRMKHPDGIGINVGGTMYKPDKDGNVLLDEAHASQAKDHGFEYVSAK